MTKKKSTKKIRENITLLDHEKILTHLRGDNKTRANTKQNLLVTFTLLYATGLRVNELTQLMIKDLKEIVTTGELIVLTHKAKKERKLFFGKATIKTIKGLFDLTKELDDSYIIRAKGNVSKSPHPITFIATVNAYIQKALNSKRYTSHSYRASLVTDLATSGTHPKVIADFMGQDIRTTMRYIRPTDTDLRNANIR